MKRIIGTFLIVYSILTYISISNSVIAFKTTVVDGATGLARHYASYPLSYEIKCGFLVAAIVAGIYLVFKKDEPIEDAAFSHGE
ncbi:hypothetical protein CN918_28955 [Priestia megaterium]|nr:hypothetical protein CN918_28955 [Priestia megaterium]